jgi:hypothetical protein
VAQDRLGPDREKRRHPAAEVRELRPTDRVGAPADRMQPPLGDAVLDRFRREAQVDQLLPRDHSVLPPGERPDG